MKKIILSLFVFLISIEYIVSQQISATTHNSPKVQDNVQEKVITQTGHLTAPNIVKDTTPLIKERQSTDTPIPIPAQSGMYVDGVYTGNGVNAYYGTVQVEATIHKGKLTSVSFLRYPGGRSTSEYINGIAMPKLKSEAIKAQSAKVSGVSGASYTSAAFRQSLGDALNKAKNI